jgi:dTMP kinase
MKFIVVDGLDGCGKDTHAENIKRLLEKEGAQVRIVSHPSQRFFGRMSKRFLQGEGPPARLFATLFFIADVLQSVRQLKSTSQGMVVFVRYLLGTAYLPSRLAPYGYVAFRNLLPRPDLAIFIDIEPEVAIRRIRARGHAPEMFETPERLAAIRNVAKGLVADEWVTIDNSIDGQAPFQAAERMLRERSFLGRAS